MVRRWLGRVARVLSPAGFVLVGLCFLLPFAAVSCDAPGGFGRAAPGGSTTYTGFDLATGGEPAVTADRVRPLQEQRDDRLAPQVLAWVVLGLSAAGLGLAAVRDRRVRRAGVAVFAVLAGVAHLANQYTVEALLAARLREQLTAPMPAGKSAEDFVQTGPGFGAVLLLVAAIAVGNGVGLLLLRRRHATQYQEMPAGRRFQAGG